MTRLVLLSLGLLLTAAPAQESAFAITEVTVIDGAGGPPVPGMTVLVDKGRIAAIGPRSDVRIPAKARTVDGKDKFLIPGLWDMHVRLDDPELWALKPKEGEKELFLPLFVLNGVTGVRDMGGDFDLIKKWRKRIGAGKLLGPRIITAGPVVDGPKPKWPGSITVANAEQGRKAVRDLKARGVDFVNVYSFLPRDVFLAIADEAKAQGIPFAGHVPDTVSPVEAARTGMQSQEQLLGILRHVGNPTAIRRALDRLGPKADAAERRRMWIDMLLATRDVRKEKELLTLFAGLGTFHTPTMVMWKRNAFFDPANKTVREQLVYMPPYIREWWTPEKNVHLRDRSPSAVEFKRMTYAMNLELLRRMHEAGVKLLVGSDAGSNVHVFPGFSVHAEMKILVEVGLTPAQAIQAATRNPAECLGLLKDHGTIEKGKVADLVLLDEDPLADIENTRAIEAVVVRGRLLDAEARAQGLNEAWRRALYVPRDLAECFRELKRMLPPKGVNEMKTGTEAEMVDYHHGLGRWLRNNWGLWGESRLKQWFMAKGIQHPDDMSGIILTSFWRHLNGKPIELEKQIRRYQDYWKKVKEREKKAKKGKKRGSP